jgi:hypothetical protein
MIAVQKNFVFAEVSSSQISLRHRPFMRESASRSDHAAMSLPSTSRPFAAAWQFAMAYSTRVKSNEVLAMAILRLLALARRGADLHADHILAGRLKTADVMNRRHEEDAIDPS